MYNELGLEHQSYRIFTLYPDLDTACQNALKFVGTNFPGESQPLIKEMVIDAFSMYKKAETTFGNPRREFIRGLCSRAIFLYRVRYCCESGSNRTVWVPMRQEISEFEKLNSPITIYNEPDPQSVTEDSAMRLFAARVLQGHLFGEVFGEDFHVAA